MRGGQILDQAGDLEAMRRRNVGAPGKHGGERGLRCRIVVLLGSRQRHHEAAGKIMRQPVHVVDLGREQKLADVGEHHIGRDRAGRVPGAVDRGRHPAGEKAFDDLDELDHGVAHVGVALGIEPVRLDHQRGGADQKIAEPGARADAGMAVMRRIGGGQQPRFLALAGEKHPLPRHEHVLEQHDPGRLAVARREFRRGFAGPARRPRRNRHAGRIHRHGTAHRESCIFRPHPPARHDQKLVHIGRRGHDRLGAADHDAVVAALGDMDVDVGICLLARPLRAVALGVRHGDSERKVRVLDALEIRQEPLMIIGAVRGIGRLRRLEAGIERIVAEIALGAAAAAAQQPDRLELVEQIG